jgi:thiamine-phosphate pyrophosphorylase
VTSPETRIGSRVSRPDRRFLIQALRLIVITDQRLASPRSVTEVVASALAAGARAIQLRAKDASGDTLLQHAGDLIGLTRAAGALLFINDRVDVALASGADGVHLGPDDLPIAAVRRATPAGLLLGYSTDDPERARQAEADGADYIGCGAVWGTATKDVGDERIGLAGLRRVAAAVTIPVIAIGGVTPSRAREIPPTGAAGVAVVGAVMAADDPGAAVRSLLDAFCRRM